MKNNMIAGEPKVRQAKNAKTKYGLILMKSLRPHLLLQSRYVEEIHLIKNMAESSTTFKWLEIST